MSLNIVSWLDVLASLGLMFAVALVYARAHVVSRLPLSNAWVIGAVFGAMAVFQMFRPIAPFDGVIVDLRNVPIALAGAFLGFRATLACLAVAMAARIGIGGVGVFAGCIGMALAAGAGLVWARATCTMARRHGWPLVALAGLNSVHLLGALALPPDARTWFFSDAALPLIGLNLAILPLVGSVMESERLNALKVARLVTDAQVDPDTGLMRIRSFYREIAARAAAQADGGYETCVSVRLRLPRWHARQLGSDERKTLLRAVFLRLRDVLEMPNCVASVGSTQIIAPLSQRQALNQEDILVALRRAINEDPFAIGNVRVQVSASVEAISLSDVAQVVHKSTSKRAKPRQSMTRMRAKAVHPKPLATALPGAEAAEQTMEAIFHKADFLMRRPGSHQGRRTRA
ncbi:LytS/YhcK type 5TM receptor domain-containing protein [Roseobacteraceae bacterium S113]